MGVGQSLVLLLLLGTCSSYTPTSIPKGAAIRGTCWDDTHCSLGQFCSVDGACVDDSPVLIVDSMSDRVWIAAVCAAIVLCLYGCTAVLNAVGVKTILPPPSYTVTTFLMTMLTFCVALAATRTIHFSSQPAPGTGVNCSHVHDLVCAPYFCDVAESQCYTECSVRAECRDGWQCRDGQCHAGVTLQRGGVSEYLLPPSAVVMIAAVAAAVITLCVCAGLSCGRYPERFPANISFGLCALLVFCVVAIITPLMMISPRMPHPLSTGAACKDHAECAPFLCDVSVQLCVAQCSSDTQCWDGYVCSEEACVADEGYLGHRTAAVWAWALLAGLGLAILLVCCGTCVCAINELEEDTTYRLWPSWCLVAVCCGGALFLTLSILPLRVDVDHTAPPGGQHCAATGASVCSPYFCDVASQRCFDTCSSHSECRYGTCDDMGVCSFSSARLSAPAVPPWLGASVGLCGVVLAFIFASSAVVYWAWSYQPLDHWIRDDDTLASVCIYASAGGCICACIAAVSLGFGLHFARTSVDSLVNASIPCFATDDVICHPYRCVAGMCVDQCSAHVECAPGFSCVGGSCLDVIEAPYVDQVDTLLFSAAAALIGFVILNTIFRRFYILSLLWAKNPGSLVALVAACAIGVSTFLCLSHVRIVLPPLAPATEKECSRLMDTQCFPMHCDTRVGRCFSSCAASTECRDSDRCVAGACVPPDLLYAKLAAGGIALATLLYMYHSYIHSSVARTSRKLAGRRDARRRAIAEQRFEEYLDTLALIPRAILDVEPKGNAIEFVQYRPDPARPSDEAECCVCYAEEAEVRLLEAGCAHGYCAECAADALKSIVDESQFPAKCTGCRSDFFGKTMSPAEDQRARIRAGMVEGLYARGILTLGLARRFISMQILRAFAKTQPVHCPVCDLLMIRDVGKDLTRAKQMSCLNVACGTSFCSSCGVLWARHVGATCEQYAASRYDAENDVIISNSAKPCPNCGASISHYKGHACHHIMPGTGCPFCGYHFCWVCLERHPCSSVRSGNGDHALFCDARCSCPPCPDCLPGKPCNHCSNPVLCYGCNGTTTGQNGPGSSSDDVSNADVEMEALDGSDRRAPRRVAASSMESDESTSDFLPPVPRAGAGKSNSDEDDGRYDKRDPSVAPPWSRLADEDPFSPMEHSHSDDAIPHLRSSSRPPPLDVKRTPHQPWNRLVDDDAAGVSPVPSGMDVARMADGRPLQRAPLRPSGLAHTVHTPHQPWNRLVDDDAVGVSPVPSGMDVARMADGRPLQRAPLPASFPHKEFEATQSSYSYSSYSYSSYSSFDPQPRPSV